MISRLGKLPKHPQSPDSSTSSLPRLADELPLRILVVDDLLIERLVTLRLLNALGYDADVAINGKEALTVLRQNAYDLVLLDLQMPEMGGLKTTRHICKEWSQVEKPCIIAVTSETSPASRTACFNAGMDAFLGKPLEIGALISALRQCCALS